MASLGIAVGAVGHALLDRRRGAARRARIRDKALSYGRRGAELARRRAFDFKWRTKGKLHEAKARLEEHGVPDHILAERVRAQIGRPVSHPRALTVSAEGGCVTLAGPILAHEVHELLARVKAVRGVREVRSELEVHHTAEHVPSLQGPGSRQAH